MVVWFECVWLEDDFLDNTRSNETLVLGSTLKMTVTLGSETLIVVLMFWFFANTNVLFMTAEPVGRGIKI